MRQAQWMPATARTPQQTAGLRKHRRGRSWLVGFDRMRRFVPVYEKTRAGSRSTRFLTFETCHRPPRAVRTPRLFNADARPLTVGIAYVLSCSILFRRHFWLKLANAPGAPFIEPSTQSWPQRPVHQEGDCRAEPNSTDHIRITGDTRLLVPPLATRW